MTVDDVLGNSLEVLPNQQMAISPGAEWQPVVRDEMIRFLREVHPESRQKTREETVQILARGVEPGKRARRAGLVVGYVQSGKTTSFTGAAALARDNGFGLVIVIAGTSTNLLDQTQERLQADLGLRDKSAYRRWLQVRSPKPDTEEAAKVAAALEDWLDPDLDPSDRATVIVSVMKQHRHLEWLVGVLEGLNGSIDLSRVTALIIDDEADQASPNQKRNGQESTTYGQIRKLRATLPSHTLLEYTATPQAPLLVSLVDELSPDFVCVINPGDAYTGGRYFFAEHRDQFVKHIPAADVEIIDDENADPPSSLQAAFASFALGCAAGRMLGSDPPQRSMLVHPSQKTLPQGRFVTWLKGIRDLWAMLLRLDPDDEDRQALITNHLQTAHRDLAVSVADLPTLDALLTRLPSVLKKTSIVEVNASKGRPEPIDWATGYSWVLVGGQLLDRGFTVEGLTVTYMPRGLGVGNADTIQQRARFFGYKSSYAGFCRAWLDTEVDVAFSGYVRHEEAMRGELVEVARSGTSLKDWKRVFLLSRTMKLTRASVIRLPTSRSSFASKWFSQRNFDGADNDLYSHNTKLIEAFCGRHSFFDDEGDPRRDPETQIHPVATVPLSDVLESLLQDYLMMDEDASDFAALRILLAVAEDNDEQEVCRVYKMVHNASRQRRRSVDDLGRIKNLFQGSNANTGYLGDRVVRDDDTVSIQLHNLELRRDDGTDEGLAGQVIATGVPVLAIWVPERFDTSVIRQRLL